MRVRVGAGTGVELLVAAIDDGARANARVALQIPAGAAVVTTVGRLTAIKKYDLSDSRDISMVSRITPTAGKEITVLEQIMGNVGRFSGPRQETNPGAPTGGGF